MMKTTAFLTLALSSCLALSAEPEVNKANNARAEAAKSSSSSSTTTTNIDGKTVSITRRTGPDGVEHVTVTTFSRSGKPKVVEMSADEFAEKYGPRKKKEPKGEPKTEEKKADEKPAPSNPGKATE